MAQFDPSCIATFRMPGDAVNLYGMIDANIFAQATANLTPAQQTVVNTYVWTPTATDFANGAPSWAGNDPAAVYFKATATQVQNALARWYK